MSDQGLRVKNAGEDLLHVVGYPMRPLKATPPVRLAFEV
jgi:hypothetical protein